MPILRAEPDVYPPNLWDHDGPKIDGERRWWCLHTKPRQEKAIARHLLSKGVFHYLPQVRHESRTPGGRKIQSLLPLFRGYMFLLGDDGEKLEALQGNRVAKILTVPDQHDLHEELRQVHTLLSSGLPISQEPELVIGTRVQIIVGPLKGVIGTIVRRGDRDRFVAQVRFLGRGAMVDLLNWQVEPLGDSPLSSLYPEDFQVSADRTPVFEFPGARTMGQGRMP